MSLHKEISFEDEICDYPRSSGRVLRHLGEMIERECELAIDHHLAEVLALKAARDDRLIVPAGTL